MASQRTPAIRSVTVYCSASNAVHPSYGDLAEQMGTLLARSGRTTVYGGGRVGLMGRLALGARQAGGTVVGIITTRFVEAEQLDRDNHEIVVVETMRERKALLDSRSQAFIILPGGLGTLEEFFEILVGRVIGDHDKPIILVNPSPRFDAGGAFYDPLLSMLDHVITERFASPRTRDLIDVCADAPAAMALLEAHERGEAASARVDRSCILPSTLAGGAAASARGAAGERA